MTEIAEAQIQRLILLVAWMSQRDTGEPVSYRTAARGLGVPEQTLQADLQVLLDLTDSYKSWLGSLRVSITGDGFTLGSRGAFQRPLRLSQDELLAMAIGLDGVRGGRALAEKLQGPRRPPVDLDGSERSWAMGPTPGPGIAGVLEILRSARDHHRKVDLLYCGSDAEASRRIVHPYQVLQSAKVWYLVAWCEKANGIRHFRAERILGLTELEEAFEPVARPPAIRTGSDLMAGGETLAATVAFSPKIARWIREQYPEGTVGPDGRYHVRFQVADPRWMIREVLQYGAEAELVAPEGLRELMRRWLA
ncbi:MAG TPA: WYL domain-containing protein [Gemmatimonadales bacterium]|nr:WYL domain-containing protein [Gemmatimonadales bacterium]